MRKEVEERALGHLSAAGFLSGADTEALKALLSEESCKVNVFAGGEKIYPSHRSKGSLVLILSGKAFRKSGGVITGEVSKGFITADEPAFFTAADRDIELTACGECKAAFIRLSAVYGLMKDDFRVALRHMRALGAKVDGIAEKEESARTDGAARKLALFIIGQSLSAEHSALDPAGISAKLGLSKAELSSAMRALIDSGAAKLDSSGLVAGDTDELLRFLR